MTIKQKKASLFDEWKREEWQSYLENLYDKISHGMPLDYQEEQILSETPDSVIRDVDQDKTRTEPYLQDEQKVPRVKRVPKKPEDQPPLSDEERAEIIAESPEATVLNTFFPELYDDNMFFVDEYMEPLRKEFVDASLNTLLYLKDLGYKNATWNTGPEHKTVFGSKKQMKNHCKPTPLSGGIPICNFLGGASFTLDDLIASAKDSAGSHGYYPPKPIIAKSHPGCNCYLVCWQPNGPEDIPDTAPGVPTFGDPEELLEYKTQIFNRIGGTPMTVDRWTVLSREVYKAVDNVKGKIVDEWDVRKAIQTQQGLRRLRKRINYEASYFNEWTKIAAEEWEESIKPVAITTGYIFRSLLGPIRPVPDTYFGFQTNVHDEYSLVFLGDMSRSIIAPIDYVRDLKLKESPSLDIDTKTYVRVGDSLGIVINVFNKNKILCYLPEFGSIVFVDSAVPMETI